jgi:hypothetical protein
MVFVRSKSVYSFLIVNNSFIYSPCEGQWLDCIPESEKYLRTQTSFYDECKVEQESSDTILNTASDNTCIGPFRCQNGQTSEEGLPHVGYDPFGTCNCSTKKNVVTDRYGATENRYKRQTGELIRKQSEACHNQRAAKGGSKQVCDTILLTIQKGYAPATRTATNELDRALDDENDQLLG